MELTVFMLNIWTNMPEQTVWTWSRPHSWPSHNLTIVIYFYSVAETLLNHGADVHAQNDAGKTA